MTKTPLFFIFLIVVGVTNAQQATIDSLKLNWEKYKLKNAITVVLQPDRSQAEVSVEFWIHTGARDEVPGKFGFAHFFEHATPYGFIKDTVLRNELRSFRTNSNAQTRKDYTRYYMQVKPAGLKLALQYTAERMNADTTDITNEIIERHRTNVLNEMDRQEANPLYSPTATSARDLAVFGKSHPYGHSNYGTLEENKSFTTTEVKDWYKQYFFTDNIILFVVGNFDTQTTKAIIEKEFGEISRQSHQTKKKQSPFKFLTTGTVLSTRSKSNFISFTWPVPAWNSPDVEKLELLSYILDERLAKDSFDSVVKFGSSQLFNLYEWVGQFGIFVSFSFIPDSTKIEEYLLKEINDIIVKGIQADELMNAKWRALNNVKEKTKQLGFIDSRTELLGEGILFVNDGDHYISRLKRQFKITTKDIQDSITKWLKPKGAKLLLISNN